MQSYVALIQLCAKKYDIMGENIRKVEWEALSGNPEEGGSKGESIEQPTSRKKGPGNASVRVRHGLTSVVLGTPFMVALTQIFKNKFQYKKNLKDLFS